MTRLPLADLLALPAGRELDYAILEVLRSDKFASGEYERLGNKVHWHNPRINKTLRLLAGSYSTTIRDAWPLLAEMLAAGVWVRMGLTVAGEFRLIPLLIYPALSPDELDNAATVPSLADAPLAICRAWATWKYAKEHTVTLEEVKREMDERTRAAAAEKERDEAKAELHRIDAAYMRLAKRADAAEGQVAKLREALGDSQPVDELAALRAVVSELQAEVSRLAGLYDVQVTRNLDQTEINHVLRRDELRLEREVQALRARLRPLEQGADMPEPHPQGYSRSGPAMDWKDGTTPHPPAAQRKETRKPPK